MGMLTTAQVAERLNIAPVSVRRLIEQGRLKATRYGRDWLVDEADLAGVTIGAGGYPRGKPRKSREPEPKEE